MWMYIGTCTGKHDGGILRCDLDMTTGALSSPVIVGETINPSFLTISSDGNYLYCVNEIQDFAGQAAGAVTAFKIDRKDGKLIQVNQQSTRGGLPCYLVIDQTGQNLLAANYWGGSVACWPIAEDGSLGGMTSFWQHEGSSVDPKRQDKPYAHSINLDPQNRFAIAADLGADKLFVYRFDADGGGLAPHDPPSTSLDPGAGPRHFMFHPDYHDVAYVINELDSTITVLSYHPSLGRLSIMQTVSTLPPNTGGENYPAELQISSNGRFLYGSNRGHDTIAIFAIDPQSGKLTAIGHEPVRGEWPRNICIDPTGNYLIVANQKSDDVLVYRVNRESGKLMPLGGPLMVSRPVCIKFLNDGQ